MHAPPMMVTRMATLEEIEIGPHFLTFYSKDYQGLQINMAKKLYYQIMAEQPLIAGYQQFELQHEPNDPNVYHPFGEPNNFRDAFRHFHVRYGRKPSLLDVKWCTQQLTTLGCLTSETLAITHLEDHKLDKYSNLNYPAIPKDRDYLEWIEELRTGEWIAEHKN